MKLNVKKQSVREFTQLAEDSRHEENAQKNVVKKQETLV